MRRSAGTVAVVVVVSRGEIVVTISKEGEGVDGEINDDDEDDGDFND